MATQTWKILLSWFLLSSCSLRASGALYELYNTKLATSDLKWTAGPDPSNYGWEEVSVYEGPTRNIIRIYQICKAGEADNDNWIRSPFIYAHGASRIHIEVEYSIQKCGALGLDEKGASLCKETFNLFYYQSDHDAATSTFPPWRHKPYTKIDTVAASTNDGINKKLFDITGLEKSGVYIALQDLGACMSLVSLRAYYYYCPENTRHLAVFPRSFTGDDSASLVPVVGVCVNHARFTDDSQPKSYCGGNGDWQISTGGCSCEPGFQPNRRHSSCEACPTGTYKLETSNAKCQSCPQNSGSLESPSDVIINNSKRSVEPRDETCPCHPGFYRAETDTAHDPCTRPPSKPSIVTSQFNATSAYLEWERPKNDGGRSDLFYRIECKECVGDKCQICEDSISLIVDEKLFGIADAELHQQAVMIVNLHPYTKYMFKIFSANGVSKIAKSSPAYEEVAIETEQDVPLPITNVVIADFTLQTAAIHWSDPIRPRGKIIQYEVEAKPRDMPTNVRLPISDEIIKKTTQDTSIVLENLQTHTEYQVRVRARTTVGFGDYGPPAMFKTGGDVIVESDSLNGNNTRFWIVFVLVIVVASAFCFVTICICSRRHKCFHDNAKKKPINKTNSRYDEINEKKILNANKINHAKQCAQEFNKQLRTTYVDYPDPQTAVLSMKMEMSPDQLMIEDSIGEGEFATVRRASLLARNGAFLENVAVKQLKYGATPKDQSNFLREACTMAQFDHPNIVRLKGVVTKSYPMMIVSEYMSNGSLDQYLKQEKHSLNISTLLHMLRGIASGMQYLSDMQFVHRDLAARNILVDSEGNCKVADFGLSRNFENDPNATYTTQGGKIALRWTAPESIRYREFTSASDVWSFGIVMWEMMSYGEKPYWDMTNKEVIQNVGDGGRLPAPTRCPKALHEMMLECWILDPKKRPTFTKLVHDLNRLIRHSSLLEACVSQSEIRNDDVIDDSILSCQSDDNCDSDSDLEGHVTVIMKERMLHV